MFLVLATLGLATLWMGVAADMGATLLVIGNSMRLLWGSNRSGILFPPVGRHHSNGFRNFKTKGARRKDREKPRTPPPRGPAPDGPPDPRNDLEPRFMVPREADSRVQEKGRLPFRHPDSRDGLDGLPYRLDKEVEILRHEEHRARPVEEAVGVLSGAPRSPGPRHIGPTQVPVGDPPVGKFDAQRNVSLEPEGPFSETPFFVPRGKDQRQSRRECDRVSQEKLVAVVQQNVAVPPSRSFPAKAAEG